MHVSRYISWILLLCVTAAAAAQDVPREVPQGIPIPQEVPREVLQEVRQNAPEISPEVPQTVILDASGVESRFVNPVDPIAIGRRPLLFVNNTGDRTFVVTIPFVYTATELASAYATADALRRDKVVSDVVCDALEWNKAQNNPKLCSDSEREEIDTLEGLRVLLEAVTAAKPTDLAACNAQLKSADCIVEAVFWTAGCRIPDASRDDVLLAFAREDPEEGPRIFPIVAKERWHPALVALCNGPLAKGDTPRADFTWGAVQDQRLVKLQTRFPRGFTSIHTVFSMQLEGLLGGTHPKGSGDDARPVTGS